MQKRKTLNTTILFNHYLWCKKEGRDTSWYGSSRSCSGDKKYN